MIETEILCLLGMFVEKETSLVREQARERVRETVCAHVYVFHLSLSFLRN